MAGLKQRSGRMAAFARGDFQRDNVETVTEAAAALGMGAEASTKKREPQSPRAKSAEATNMPAHGQMGLPQGPEEHQMNHDSGAAVPATSTPVQEVIEEAPAVEQQHPLPEEPGKRDIFAGSVFEDDFTQSVFSTPRSGHTQRDYAEELNHQGDLRRYTGADRLHAQSPRPREPRRREGQLQFLVGEDGTMDVGPMRPSQGGFEVRDGFHMQDRSSKGPPQHGRFTAATGRPSRSQDRQQMRQVHVRGQEPNDYVQPEPKRESRLPHGRDQSLSRLPQHRHSLSRPHALERFARGGTFVNKASDEGHLLDEDWDRQNMATRDRVGFATSQEPVNGTAKKRTRHASPDYDDAALREMEFTDLQGQPFDLDSAGKARQNGHKEEARSLEDHLRGHSDLDPEQQQRFFESLPLEEWEAAGDWFVDRFTDLMKRLKDARRDKRRTVDGFEREAAERERAIRSRSEHIDLKLSKMKQDGRRVVGN